MLTKQKTVSTKYEFVEKKRKIKVSQKDIDNLNRKIAKDVKKGSSRVLPDNCPEIFL